MKTRLMMAVSMLAVAAGGSMAQAAEGGMWSHIIDVSYAKAATVTEVMVVGTVSDPDALAPTPIKMVLTAGATVLHGDKACHPMNAPTYDLTVSFAAPNYKQPASHRFDSNNAKGDMSNGPKAIAGVGERADKIMGTPNIAQVRIRTIKCRKFGEKWMVMQLVDPRTSVVAVKVGLAGTLVQMPPCTLPPGHAGTACADVVELGYDLQVADGATLADSLVGKLLAVAEAVRSGRFGDARRLARAARLEIPR